MSAMYAAEPLVSENSRPAAKRLAELKSEPTHGGGYAALDRPWTGVVNSDCVSDAADLIDAISGFAWPLLIVAIILIFREPIRNFIGGATEANVKAGAFEASLKRTAEVAASIASAEASRAAPGAGEVGEPQRAASAVAQAVAALPDEQTQPKVLWVDDRPENNALERQAFEQLGIAVELARSTDEAVDALQTEDFDLVITDMGRPEGAHAGYDLPAVIQRLGLDIPVIIYSFNRSTEELAEAKTRGVYASTESPTQLLRHVTAALADQAGNQESKSRRWPRLQFK